jgi:hypothetical protein
LSERTRGESRDLENHHKNSGQGSSFSSHTHGNIATASSGWIWCMDDNRRNIPRCTLDFETELTYFRAESKLPLCPTNPLDVLIEQRPMRTLFRVCGMEEGPEEESTSLGESCSCVGHSFPRNRSVLGYTDIGSRSSLNSLVSSEFFTVHHVL